MKLFAIYITNNAAVYDAWGNIIESSGSMAEINPFRYRGDYYDTEE